MPRFGTRQINVSEVACHVIDQLPSPPDGYCAEAVVAMCEYLADRGIDARICAYLAPNHPGPHYTVVAGGIEYDPTVGYANWSRQLDIPRGKLYVVTEESPHHQWNVLR